MSGHGDHYHEMRNHRHDLDAALEAALAGRQPAGEHDATVASFVEAVRSSATATSPRPSAELAAILSAGLTTDKGDLPVTAGSNVPGPVQQAAGLPKWRRRKMIEVAIGKLASLGLAAKLGIASAAVAAATTGAGASGVLPGPAQDAFDRVSSVVTGQDLPDQADPADQADVADHAGRPDQVGGQPDGQPDGQVGDQQVEPDPAPVNEDVTEVIETSENDGSDFGGEVADTADANRQDDAATGDTDIPVSTGPDAADNQYRADNQPAQPPADTPAGGDVPDGAGSQASQQSSRTSSQPDDTLHDGDSGQATADSYTPDDPPADAPDGPPSRP